MSGEGYVAAAVRDRVKQTADRLGYVPHAMASRLRKQDSTLIGLLVSDLRNPFYAELASGIGHYAKENGYTVMLVDDRGSVEEELGAARELVGMRVCGVLVTPLSGEVSTYLNQQRIPFVESGRTFSNGNSDTVLVDNVGASRRMVELLIGFDHRRIAMVIDETSWTTGADRHSGYR